MNERQLQLALRRQRLQMRSEQLRGQWQQHMANLAPAVATANRVGDGVRWLQRHPEIIAGVGVAAVVARPKTAWRWLRRSWVAWRFWQKRRHWLDWLGTLSALKPPGKRT